MKLFDLFIQLSCCLFLLLLNNTEPRAPKVINDIKLRYLCRNKLPRIILVLMHGDDYVINTSSIRPGVRR